MRWLDASYGFGRRVRSALTTTRQYGARWAARVLPVLIIGVIGVILSVGAGFRVAYYWEDKNVQTGLELSGENRRLALQNGLTDLEHIILAVARQFELSDKAVTHLEFDRVTDPENGIFDTSLEIAWAPRLRRDDRINTLGPDARPVSAAGQDEYFPILFARNRSETSPHFGFDIQSDPAQREAMERILDGAPLAATAPMKQANSGRPSVVFLLAPEFGFGLPHDTPQDRRRNLVGFVRVAIAPGALIDEILRGQKSPQGVDISFFQAGAGLTEFPFYIRSSLLRSVPAVARPRGELEAGLHWIGDLTLADARWTMVVTPIPGATFLAGHEPAVLVAAMGLLLTAAIMTYVEITRRNNLSLRGLVTNLRESEARFRRVTDNAHDAIIKADVEGNVNFWNPAAERIFGYKEKEILGRSVHQLLTPERYRTKAHAELTRFSQTGEGAVVGRTVELYGLRKDGSEFPIDLSVSAVPRGDAWSSIAIVRDVTERVRTADTLKQRSELLRAVSIVAAELLTAATVKDAIPKVLKTIGEAARVDRVLIVETKHEEGKEPVPVLRYYWSSPNAPDPLDQSSFAQMAPAELEMDPWLAPLGEGRAVTGLARAMKDGAAKALFTRFGIVTMLDVPMTIEGTPWGRIGFDDCKTEREWTSIDVDILQTVADLIGGSMMRERYIAQIKNANAIIERSPTVLFRLRGEPPLPMIYVSQNVDQFGYDPAEMIESPELYKTLQHPDDTAKVLESLVAAATEGGGPASLEFRLRRSDGVYRWVEGYSTPVRDSAGRLLEIEGTMTDITERKEAQEKIALLARTDSLTGLANRATFLDRLQQSFAAAKRGASPFAVLYLDLDRFKDVNDTLGHGMGDLLLKAVADRLTSGCREADLPARLGGDEFAILQSELTDPSGATALAATIRDLLTAPYRFGESEMQITVSIGIASYTSESSGPKEMLEQADLALYRAKEEGRDQFRFHSEELDKEARERVALRADLARAIDRNELELYYQPQLELATSRIVGMEALIRWNHPRRGVLKPADFMSIGEKAGVSIALGHWVLDHACEQMNAWRKAGIAPSTLAVNLSLGQLKTGDKFVDDVMQTLAKWGLEPKELELDVTEAMLAHVTLMHNNVLDRLQQLGVQIAIDDFGTQYSSLCYLRTYHVSRLKIPRSVMEAATHDSGSLAMVRAIIGIARELNIEVVAQGVETEKQRALLTSAPSPTKVQGFYYSEPVQADRAAELLRNERIEPRLGARLDAKPAA
ncbi:diguanylate cyclase/phosphodiesterase with PAS/PAC and GAF sensor(s) [Methylocella silvestris BL2]|uniref:Diguanylate cyclase/phosphodiesterase with PAS/PAC and GAF sensor(S) n=1 Tax=Methylocella silvestris (strain DSM 15510 / CIP 108128 / LMG 27833 / NCIMB 13906 / BL2) TaxID=395965 RepID=B8ERS3_METSB|nr:EAL domain-containing protein [Methylocella silvestris]ACK51621.1 diguanylate cyclase/phosphodiesterase with PAS/PAC and GAF sensor(s) [Methylocella silvestris BL2]